MERKKQVAKTEAPAAPRAPSRRRQRSRERVIQAAMELFVRQGFDQTPVRQIVAASGISMRTFFRYFPTKMDLAFPRADEGTQRLRDLLHKHAVPRDPLAGVSDALVEFGHWYMEMKDDLLREWKYESRSTDLIARGTLIQARNQALIADALEAGGLASRRARYLAAVIFGGIGADLEDWFEDECRQDLLALSRDTLVLIRGLGRLFPEAARGPASPNP